MDINSIIEMINKIRPDEEITHREAGYSEACDDIIEQLKHIEQLQSFDTAPKDGTHFLAYREGEESYSEAWWRPDVQSFGGKGWRYPDNSGPTHWMPLPPKPTGGVK